MVEKFIFTSVASLIDDAFSSLNVCAQSVAMQPLIKYTLDSLYLQITGTIEQKLFLITWQIATNERDIRYDVFKGDLKSMSTLDAKGKIYKNLIRKIRENTDFHDYTVQSTRLFNESKQYIDKISKTSPICFCKYRQILTYNCLANEIATHMMDFNYTYSQADSYELFSELNTGQLTDEKKNMERSNKNKRLGNTRDGNILGFKNDLLERIYKDFIYKKRNALAHNTKKIPAPTIANIFKEKCFMFDNIFIHLLILLYIDNIFISLYRDYKKTL